MNILIVEDDENKLGIIMSALTPFECSVDVSSSIQSGIRSVRSKEYSLILLDMTLPRFDQGPDEPDVEVEIFGGEEFLTQLRRFGKTTPVAIITQFEIFGTGSTAVSKEDLDRRLASQFPDFYAGMIYYNSAFSEWRQQLAQVVESRGNR